jgi:hypothetical protein
VATQIAAKGAAFRVQESLMNLLVDAVYSFYFAKRACPALDAFATGQAGHLEIGRPRGAQQQSASSHELQPTPVNDGVVGSPAVAHDDPAPGLPIRPSRARLPSRTLGHVSQYSTR